MSLFDPEDPNGWSRVIDSLIVRGPTISADDAQALIDKLVGQRDWEDVEDALEYAGFQRDDDDYRIWHLVTVPIMGTGDEDSFTHGGGIVLYDSLPDEFVWFWWPEPEEDDVDDDGDPTLSYQVRWFRFPAEGSILKAADLDEDDIAAIASRSGLDVQDVLDLARSDSVVDRVSVLEDVVSSIGGNRLDDSPVHWSGEEITRELGPHTDLVARRRRKDIEQLVTRLRGARVPSSPSDEIDQLLEVINQRRRELGMRNLDPVAAGWSDEDVRIEAQRLREGNPPSSLKGELLWW